MYRVICVNNGIEHTLMDLRDEDYIIDTPKLTLLLNGAGTFTFRIHPSHPETASIKTLVSLVKVYKINGAEQKWMFTGRVISDERDIYNNKTVKCSGILAYLNDSIVRPYEFQGTPADYVKQLIGRHNEQVNEEKQFTISTLDLADADSSNNITRANKNYPSTYREMNDKVVELLGAYISAHEGDDGKLYFDCSQAITHYNAQAIRLGENIIDMTQLRNAEEMRTVMIGIGAEDEEGSRPSVAVINPDAADAYGRIEGTVKFENVTTLEQLEKKTEAYLDSVLAETNTIEVNAVDLSMTDTEIEGIELGYAYVESAYNGLEHVRMLVSRMDIYLMQPDKNKFTLGAERKSISSTVSNSAAEIDRKAEETARSADKKINAAVENATQLITGVKGGYVILDCGEDAGQPPEQILIMDAPEKENAVNVIRINKNGIGFSTSGYDGIYANAWTIDGNLVADFITAGTMYADRVRGGTLEIGGEKDGEITVLDAAGGTIATINKDGVEVSKGSISGTAITVGGGNNADGEITVLDAAGGIIATINKDGVEVSKGSISGTAITSSNGSRWVKIDSGGITIGSGAITTGKINFTTGGLEFRGNTLIFCMDSIKCGTSMNTSDVKQAYTGDIKYSVRQEDESIGDAVMSFRNGILMDNG